MAVALVASPDKSGVGTRPYPLRPKHVEVVIAIQVVDEGEVAQRGTELSLVPGRSGQARVSPPPLARSDIGQPVPIEVPRRDEDGPLIQIRDTVPPPPVERQSGLVPWTSGGASVEQDIDPRCPPVVRLDQNVQVTVPIEIRKPRFVVADPFCQQFTVELTTPIASEQQHSCPRIGLMPSPSPHFRHQDVEISVPVDISNLKRVPVHDSAFEPVRPPARSIPLVPPGRAVQIARSQDDLRAATRHQLPDRRPAKAHAGIDGVHRKSPAGFVAVPVSASDQVHRAVPVDVSCSQAFVRHVLVPPIDGRCTPGPRSVGICGDLGAQQGLGLLVPKDELGPSVAVEVTEDLVVVLVRP